MGNPTDGHRARTRFLGSEAKTMIIILTHESALQATWQHSDSAFIGGFRTAVVRLQHNSQQEQNLIFSSSTVH